MANVSNSRLVGEGIASGFVGAAVATIVWLAATTAGVGDAVEVPVRGLASLAWFHLVGAGIGAGFGAGLVALLVDGRRSARRLFTGIAVVVLVLSAVPLVAQPGSVSMATRIVLAVTHGIVYLAVVPRLGSRLRAR